MADFLIDTNVLIDISKGSVKAADFVDNLEGSIFLSRISAMELIVGAKDKRDQEIIEDFLEAYEIKELFSAVGDKAYDYLKQYALSCDISLIDALIAATASMNNLVLVSKNEMHFRPLKSLQFLKAEY